MPGHHNLRLKYIEVLQQHEHWLDRLGAVDPDKQPKDGWA